MAVLKKRGLFYIHLPRCRKASSLQTCLSTLTKPATLLFDPDGSVRNATARRQRLEFEIEKVKVRKSNKLTIRISNIQKKLSLRYSMAGLVQT